MTAAISGKTRQPQATRIANFASYERARTNVHLCGAQKVTTRTSDGALQFCQMDWYAARHLSGFSDQRAGWQAN
jgi:hypothetical protein